MMRKYLLVGASAFVLGAGTMAFVSRPAAADAPARPIDFNREVRPILANHCFACHGPDEHERVDVDPLVSFKALGLVPRRFFG